MFSSGPQDLSKGGLYDDGDVSGGGGVAGLLGPEAEEGKRRVIRGGWRHGSGREWCVMGQKRGCQCFARRMDGRARWLWGSG
ncbi:hypothetical protein Tco_0753891 [Tanacetum coccineum]